MIEPAEASRLIAAAMPAAQTQTVALDDAYGRQLAQRVVADRDQPPFDRVTMDGIALNSEAVAASGRAFSVAGVQAAGAPPGQLMQADQCLEVMTGAVLPEGCDCVVPVEEITLSDDKAVLDAPNLIAPWRFVHRCGTDYASGHTLLEPGLTLRGPELAVLASVGQARVEVVRRPSIMVVATGDELVEPGAPVAPHQIRMANDYAIQGRLFGLGLDRVVRTHLRDDPQLIGTVLGQALAEFDVLVLTGGVSRGKFDYVPQVLEKLGVAKHFHRVRQKPGKPMWFGIGRKGQPVFALPGNPVSALVCFHRYVEPALRSMGGEAPVVRTVRLAEPMSFANDMTRFVPVMVDQRNASLQAHPVELNTSGDFFGLAGTAGFCELDAQARTWKAGSEVPFFPW